MPKTQTINDNIFRKINTESDYNRSIGILRDTIKVITPEMAAEKIVETGFKYLPGAHELEVYVNGNYTRVNETIDGIIYGDYDEYSNFSVRFNSNVILANDIVRFRVTSANYKIINRVNESDIIAINNNLKQLATDVFGDQYTLIENPDGSTRTVGQFSNGETEINLSDYRTWYTSNTGAIITNFFGCHQDDERHIIFKNNLTTISNTGNIRLAKNEPLTGITEQIITFIYHDGIWKESSSSTAAVKKTTENITALDWTTDLDNTLYEIDISDLNNKYIMTTCFDSTSEQQIQILNLALASANFCYLRMVSNSDQTIKFMATISDTQNTIEIDDWVSSGGLFYADVDISPNSTATSLVACYEYETNSLIEPTEIEILNSTTLRIWLPEEKILLVLTTNSNYNHTIATTDWLLDAPSGKYYHDNDISGLDSTTMVTYFYDNDTKLAILPYQVELTDPSTLRIWMPNNTKNIVVLLNTTLNMFKLIQLVGTIPLKTYSSTKVIHLTSDDFVINGTNLLTNTAILFGSTDYDYEILDGNRIKIWSNNSVPIKVVVIE